MNRSLSILFVTTIVTLAALPAQAPPPPRVVGLNLGGVAFTQDPGTCAVQSCPMGAIIPPAPTPLAGGVAHDASDGGTWITNGNLLVKIDMRAQCVPLCPPQAMPLTPGATFATGLAFSEASQTLWASYDNNTIARLGVAGCAVNLAGFCAAPTALNHMITALATDDVQGTVYYGTTPLAGATTVFGVVQVAPMTAPCTPICRFGIPDCTGALLGRMLGLGFDPCQNGLFGTDGGQLSGVRVVNCAVVGPLGCCPAAAASPIIGLDVLPSHAVRMGLSCTQGACPSCPAMRHDTIGDPTIGNPSFALTLQNAPASSVAILVLSIGSHCTPPGFAFFFCGPLLTPPPFTTVGGFPTGGGAGCTGGVIFPLALPANPALCGIPMSSQWVGFCSPAVATDNFVSNCLSWTIGGS
ncbi:MAG: hypothetical protein AB7I19_16840 [Planctomycetota bacterium]